MTDKQLRVLKSVLAGVVADDSPLFQDEDFDDETLIADLTSKINSKFTGKVMGDATNKIVNKLVEIGMIDPNEVNLTDLKKAKLPDLVNMLSDLTSKRIDKTLADKMTESQKTVAEQSEAIRKAVADQYSGKIAEYETTIGGYKKKEFDYNLNKALNAAMPKDFKPSDVQIKAVKSILSEQADVQFNEDGNVSIFHKGTETPFGLKLDKPQILSINEVVPNIVKELGLWTEKPKVENGNFNRFAQLPEKNDQAPLTGKDARLADAKNIFNGH